jgi:integrase
MSNGRYRGVRGSVVDLWHKQQKQPDGSVILVPSKQYGRGKRFAARYVDSESREHQRAFELKREAEKWLREQLALVDQGRHVPPRAGRATVTQVYETHVGGADGHLAKATRQKRKTVWRRYIEPRWGRVPVNQITRSALMAWVTELRDAGMSAGYIRIVVYFLSHILDVAVEQQIIARSPAKGLPLPRGVGRRRGYLTHEQVQLLAEEAEAVGGRRIDALVVLWMAYAGTRIDETSRLQVGDVNPHHPACAGASGQGW